MIADDKIEETIRELEEEQKHIAHCAGMIDYKSFKRFQHNAACGMIKFGGSFTEFLGRALFAADDTNSVKIIRVWQSMVTEHEMLYRISEAKRKAEHEQRSDQPVTLQE